MLIGLIKKEKGKTLLKVLIVSRSLDKTVSYSCLFGIYSVNWSLRSQIRFLVSKMIDIDIWSLDFLFFHISFSQFSNSFGVLRQVTKNEN